MDDVRAVMDAAGSERAALLGHSEGGNMCIVFSASFPERTSALVLLGSYAKRARSDDYPWAPDPADREREIEEAERTWGRVDFAPTLAPSLAEDEAFRSWFKRYLRLSASPRAAAALLRMNTTIDTRAVLPAIRVPTLCIYRTDDPDVKAEEGRYIADRIPGRGSSSSLAADHLMWAGDSSAILDEVEGFLTGVRRGPEPDRVLTTVLFTDIVGSTERAAAIGDRAWSELVGRHHAAIRRELERSEGSRSTPRGTGSWRCSTVRRGRSDARSRSGMRWRSWGWRSARGSIRARSSVPAPASAVWRSTWVRASRIGHDRERCSSPAP